MQTSPVYQERSAESYGLCEGREMAQMLGALARICFVFLRKLVLGNRGESNSRLLDETVMESLNFDFQPLHRIQLELTPSLTFQHTKPQESC